MEAGQTAYYWTEPLIKGKIVRKLHKGTIINVDKFGYKFCVSHMDGKKAIYKAFSPEDIGRFVFMDMRSLLIRLERFV